MADGFQMCQWATCALSPSTLSSSPCSSCISWPSSGIFVSGWQQVLFLLRNLAHRRLPSTTATNPQVSGKPKCSEHSGHCSPRSATATYAFAFSTASDRGDMARARSRQLSKYSALVSLNKSPSNSDSRLRLAGTAFKYYSLLALPATLLA